MRAAVLLAPERIEMRDVPEPEPGPDDVIVRVARCGICGTDLHIFDGHYSADRLPLIPGHEIVGTVERAGAAVTELKPGDRVVVDNAIGCGRCFYCRRNEILNCPEMVQLGIHVDGGFAERVRVPARLAIPIPDDMPFDRAAVTEPLACVVRAQKKIGLSLGESALVIGAGPIGNLHAQLARLMGAAPVIVAELNPVRARIAEECGADIVVTDPDRLEAEVRAATGGRGVDVAIESVGAIPLYETALRLIRPGGRVAAFGLTGAEARLAVSPLDMVLREQEIRGSVAGMGEDMRQALTLLAHGRIQDAPFRREARPLDGLARAIRDFRSDPALLKIQIEAA
jgi:2-desacetyl-2-hydroxyethyl bacteriochlorophyllide A dehydrogenase